MFGRIIEAIILLLGLLVTAFVVIAIPMKSYNEYKDYLAQIEQQNEENKQATDAPVADSYDAILDNEFASDKENTLNLVFSDGGAPGISTSGSHKVEVNNGSPESGGIGDLDNAGSYVYYEFVMDEPGTVDFIWNVAGSNYNSSTNANDGLEDMAAHMTVTIDGKPVNVSGIALPADGEYPWWNLQKIVIKDVVLDAGVHTFKCDITAKGGINVGSMTVCSTKDVSVRTASVTSVNVSVEGNKVY